MLKSPTPRNNSTYRKYLNLFLCYIGTAVTIADSRRDELSDRMDKLSDLLDNDQLRCLNGLSSDWNWLNNGGKLTKAQLTDAARARAERALPALLEAELEGDWWTVLEYLRVAACKFTVRELATRRRQAYLALELGGMAAAYAMFQRCTPGA